MLIRHKKKIIGKFFGLFGNFTSNFRDRNDRSFSSWYPFLDQQFLLKRLADAAIDIYAMVAVLSR